MAATLNQLHDWESRLYAVVAEMEVAYGEPGSDYPPTSNMATYLAFRAVYDERRELERADFAALGRIRPGQEGAA